jgi:hypothetical protein
MDPTNIKIRERVEKLQYYNMLQDFISPVIDN